MKGINVCQVFLHAETINSLKMDAFIQFLHADISITMYRQLLQSRRDQQQVSI